MDVSEVRKLDAYLKKLFGNAQIRVVPKTGDTAEVFVGEDDLGELILDDEDGDRSFNFRMVIQVGSDPSIQPVPTLNAYLRRKFDNENIRVVTRPKKTDSLEVYIGEEFLGVLFLENEKGRKSYIFELPILDVDLVDSDLSFSSAHSRPRLRGGRPSSWESSVLGPGFPAFAGDDADDRLARMQPRDQPVDAVGDALPVA